MTCRKKLLDYIIFHTTDLIVSNSKAPGTCILMKWFPSFPSQDGSEQMYRVLCLKSLYNQIKKKIIRKEKNWIQITEVGFKHTISKLYLRIFGGLRFSYYNTSAADVSLSCQAQLSVHIDLCGWNIMGNIYDIRITHVHYQWHYFNVFVLIEILLQTCT